MLCRVGFINAAETHYDKSYVNVLKSEVQWQLRLLVYIYL